jgi:hypothetical protein
MSSGLEAGFLLDQQWHWLRGEMDTTKKPVLGALVRVLDFANVSYAIIGGVAVQVHHPDPRTTLDIEVAVLSVDDIPRDALIAAGFKSTGSFEHPENWVAENGTPVQFTDDSGLAGVRSAEEIPLENVTLRVIRAVDLVRQKLRAGSDPARRRSKRLSDLVDAQGLLETYPDLRIQLTSEELAVLDQLPFRTARRGDRA